LPVVDDAKELISALQNISQPYFEGYEDELKKYEFGMDRLELAFLMIFFFPEKFDVFKNCNLIFVGGTGLDSLVCVLQITA